HTTRIKRNTCLPLCPRLCARLPSRLTRMAFLFPPRLQQRVNLSFRNSHHSPRQSIKKLKRRRLRLFLWLRFHVAIMPHPALHRICYLRRLPRPSLGRRKTFGASAVFARELEPSEPLAENTTQGRPEAA